MPRPSSTSRERARPRRVAMKLVVALAGLSVAAASTIKRVGVVIAPGFELLDALGPYETLKEVEEGYYTQIDIANRTRWTAVESIGARHARPLRGSMRPPWSNGACVSPQNTPPEAKRSRDRKRGGGGGGE